MNREHWNSYRTLDRDEENGTPNGAYIWLFPILMYLISHAASTYSRDVHSRSDLRDRRSLHTISSYGSFRDKTQIPASLNERFENGCEISAKVNSSRRSQRQPSTRYSPLPAPSQLHARRRFLSPYPSTRGDDVSDDEFTPRSQLNRHPSTMPSTLRNHLNRRLERHVAPQQHRERDRSEYESDDDGVAEEHDYRTHNSNLPPVDVTHQPTQQNTRPTNRPKRHPAASLRFKSQIREHLDKLLRHDPFNPSVNVGTAEATEFARKWKNRRLGSSLACCDVDNFRLVLHSMPKCDWNASAARIFSRDFIHIYKQGTTDLTKIEAAFFVRVKSLQKEWKRRQLPSSQIKALKSADRKVKRKHGLFDRRVFTVSNTSELRQFQSTIEGIGWQAMSTDESDQSEDEPSENFQESEHENQGSELVKSCTVLQPRWRSPLLSRALHSLDILYPSVKTATNFNQRGQLPHFRVHEPDAFSNSPTYPPVLSVDAYDKEWLHRYRDDISCNVRPDHSQLLNLVPLLNTLDSLIGLKRKRRSRRKTTDQ
ncbi:hypothetical protein BJ165DRAFT_860572 [Panaeolus papilionaceus]|nr:hypothetical protein BJ165DRAFT_860572 [Panaeolus papilionaceus]